MSECVYKTSGGMCKKFSNDLVTEVCTEGNCEFESFTNVDWLRAMSDEELASWIYSAIERVVTRNPALERPVDRDGWLSWLRNERE